MEDIENECDEEIARISQVSEDEDHVLHRNHQDTTRHDIPRPMSWDGELSDGDGEVRRSTKLLPSHKVKGPPILSHHLTH